MNYLYLALTALPIIVGLDLLWLGVIMRSYYQTTLAHLLSPAISWAPAVIFYLVYALGLTIFAIWPGVSARSLTSAAGLGLLFGFFAYATYDLTNMATLRDWPLSVTLLDISWGAFMAALVSGATYVIATRFFGF